MYDKAQMQLTRRKRSKLGTAFVLALVVCLLLFAIYLKAASPGDCPATGSSPTQVKFWVKATGSENIKLRLATVDAFVLIPPAVLSLIQGSSSSQPSVRASAVLVKDAFAESGHWFRPPPIS